MSEHRFEAGEWVFVQAGITEFYVSSSLSPLIHVHTFQILKSVLQIY